MDVSFPFHFSTYVWTGSWEGLSTSHFVTSIGNSRVTDLAFPDDAVILAKTLEVLVLALEVVDEEPKALGLTG